MTSWGESVEKVGGAVSNNENEAKRARILVVDDDRGTRLVLRHALEKEDFEVLEAGDGLEALSIFDQERPDLVIMDGMMPRLDGFTACSQLRKKYGGATPVLMLTGLNDDKSVELAFESGALDYITKPINWAVMTRRVNRLLQARATELLLNRSEEKANYIFSHSMDGIITIDGHGRIISFNPAAESMFGYSSQEISGWDVSVILSLPGLFEERVPGDTKMEYFEGETINITLETAGKRRGGTAFPVMLTISGFHTGDRLLTVRDITELKRAEEKLHLAARLIESATEGILVYDADNIICQVNRAFTEITGYSEEDVIGRDIEEFKFDCLDKDTRLAMQAALMKDGRWQGEILSRRKDGQAYPERLSISAIKDNRGQATHFAVIFNDITERVRLMEERRNLMEQTMRSQRLASLGTVSAGIAHEINQPLNSIKVIVDGMLYWHKKGRFPDNDKLIENLQKISARAGRIEDIIRHMRSFVSAGCSVRCEPCSLNDAVRGALGMMGHQISSHGILVNKQLQNELPAVYGNCARLEEVVVNLLLNAMHALDQLNSRDKEIICRTDYYGRKVILEISDNGPGIEDQIIDRIFDPFFTTRQAGEGMGMGLSIVHSIVSGCGGEISVFNNIRGGATFRLEFRPEGQPLGVEVSLDEPSSR